MENKLSEDDDSTLCELIKEKITLARRLAQCLNSSLPAGLHENALITYDIILDNILKHNNNHLGNDLALYSSGLFPFFQNASPSNKQDYLLKIIKGKLSSIAFSIEYAIFSPTTLPILPIKKPLSITQIITSSPLIFPLPLLTAS